MGLLFRPKRSKCDQRIAVELERLIDFDSITVTMLTMSSKECQQFGVQQCWINTEREEEERKLAEYEYEYELEPDDDDEEDGTGATAP